MSWGCWRHLHHFDPIGHNPEGLPLMGVWLLITERHRSLPSGVDYLYQSPPLLPSAYYHRRLLPINCRHPTHLLRLPFPDEVVVVVPGGGSSFDPRLLENSLVGMVLHTPLYSGQE